MAIELTKQDWAEVYIPFPMQIKIYRYLGYGVFIPSENPDDYIVIGAGARELMPAFGRVIRRVVRAQKLLNAGFECIEDPKLERAKAIKLSTYGTFKILEEAGFDFCKKLMAQTWGYHNRLEALRRELVELSASHDGTEERRSEHFIAHKSVAKSETEAFFAISMDGVQILAAFGRPDPSAVANIRVESTGATVDPEGKNTKVASVDALSGYSTQEPVDPGSEHGKVG
jgi:hypothetical protein